MRLPALAALILVSAPALADPGDIPLVAIGLPFAPETPAPVAPDHVLYHDVAVGEIEGLPSTIKSSALNWIAAAKRSSVNEGLVETFRRMNLLGTDAAARKRLGVRWVGSRTPFRIATRNQASVTLHYRLTRADTGQLLFERDITTSAKGDGVDASMRDNGAVRAAVAANFASAAWCIDRAAYGPAPANCALTPRYSVSVVRAPR
jgi:hypothetical protein